MGRRLWIIVAGLSGFLAVALGAVGSHALQDQMSVHDYDNFTLASQFHLMHSLAILGSGMLAQRGQPLASLAGLFFLAGLFLFCGALYSTWLTESTIIAMAAPFGGISFMIGWLLIAIGGFKQPALD